MLEVERPIEVFLEILGRRGSFPILWALVRGPQRFSALQQETGLPPRTLSLRLKELEDFALVSRTAYSQVPPRVDYALTKKGEGLKGALEALLEWEKTL
ncbi:MAG: winged helix-turn-helix transcriptional regulator [Deinococcota bacterium]|uniref:winged helix-turn-helix transcriptional regulator n=1 Tax=Allomeiothermus silvanus TaxID=52022 RepID=UPI0023567A23|nr:helix-turn-helix domain-containing protein [Allomeiothermus silvanus]MBI5811529.1 helix-turn-helix transcriptional regulator [Allomeiothermus silvanus]MCL6569516.1 helix-turn-helix transcriptional regulator [Allomeiothermus silvanus]